MNLKVKAVGENPFSAPKGEHGPDDLPKLDYLFSREDRGALSLFDS